MRHDSLDTFTRLGAAALGKGPVAIILAEDAVELDSTLAHHRKAGFATTVLFAAPGLTLAEPDAPGLRRAR